jgi:hypothetical protein
MAAVFALIFLFVVASIGFMVKSLPATLTFGSVFAIACFIALAVGVFVALFRLARRWENEAPTGE